MYGDEFLSRYLAMLQVKGFTYMNVGPGSAQDVQVEADVQALQNGMHLYKIKK